MEVSLITGGCSNVGITYTIPGTVIPRDKNCERNRQLHESRSNAKGRQLHETSMWHACGMHACGRHNARYKQLRVIMQGAGNCMRRV